MRITTDNPTRFSIRISDFLRISGFGSRIAAAAALLCLCTLALAAPVDQVPALASPDPAARERATFALLQDTSLDDAALESLFAVAATREQVQRLLTVARHHVIRRMREADFAVRGSGSLGISQRILIPGVADDDGRPQAPPGLNAPNRPAPGPGLDAAGAAAAGYGVIVNDTFPGFPAYAVLRPGDRIVGLNDIRIGGQISADNFQEMIKLNPAGREVRLRVLRGGEELEVAVTLAPSNALSAFYAGPGGTLDAAYETQWTAARDRLLTHVAPGLTDPAPLSPGPWPDADAPADAPPVEPN